MIIHDLDILGAAGTPHEADAPLVVDADRMLTKPISLQRFEPVARRRTQVVQGPDRI